MKRRMVEVNPPAATPSFSKGICSETDYFSQVDKFLRQRFKYFSDLSPGPVVMGVSNLVGHKKDYSKNRPVLCRPFIYPTLQIDPYTLATVEEIVTMKSISFNARRERRLYADIFKGQALGVDQVGFCGEVATNLQLLNLLVRPV